MQSPVEIKRIEGRGISVSWSDGATHMLECKLLRESCPCARCREERGDTSHAKPLSGSKPKSAFKIVESSLAEETDLKSIWAVGQYAIGLRWGDGHDTGIYTYDYLRKLGDALDMPAAG